MASVIDPKSQIRFDVPLEEYLAADALSAHDITKLLKSPRHYNYCRDKSATPAMVKGGAVHCAVFEPKRFLKDYITYAGDKRTKEWKDFKAAHANKTILDTDDYKAVTGMADSIHEHLVAGPLVEDGKPEASLLWNDGGVKCKGRLDLLRPESIVELKSTTSAAPDDFVRTSFNMGYTIKYRWYQRGLLATTNKLLPVLVIAVEQTEPYDVVLYRVPEYALEYAEQKCAAALDRYRECIASHRWPGMSEEILMLDLPAWVRSQYQPPVELTIGGQKMEM